MKYSALHTIITFCIFLFSCKPAELSDTKAYLKYLSDKENGLAFEKTVSGIKYKVKYLPADYLAYNTSSGLPNLSKTAKDSILNCYSNSLTFLLNVGPDDNEDFDITKVGISSYEEFAERIEKMAFETQELISMEVNGETYKPSIVRMENLNALERSRNFIVVFNTVENSNSRSSDSDICFCYNDELFNTGLNKFVFKNEDLKEVPKLKF